ncbi:MAG: KH domain-containing protein [Oscillospiraceae bacterium]|jgi:predicted RNA-binding protein YlqC (UPF0109 family)|nr:KH domain-containing protein [Oscillospiraceae bacterium]
MNELLKYIAQNLVDHPDEVSVTERPGDNETILELHVAHGDMGQVIGRGGRIANDLRIILRALAHRQGQRVSVDIVT